MEDIRVECDTPRHASNFESCFSPNKHVSATLLTWDQCQRRRPTSAKPKQVEQQQMKKTKRATRQRPSSVVTRKVHSARDNRVESERAEFSSSSFSRNALCRKKARPGSAVTRKPINITNKKRPSTSQVRLAASQPRKTVLVQSKTNQSVHSFCSALSDWDICEKNIKKGLTATELASYDMLLTVDDLERYEAINKCQDVYFNHFERNSEITTKCGLTINIQDLQWTCGVNGESIYPRCYTLSSSADIAAFVSDFRNTAAASVLCLFVKFGELALDYIDEHTVKLALMVCEQQLLALTGHVHQTRSLHDDEWEMILDASHNLSNRLLFAPMIASATHGPLHARAASVARSLQSRNPQWNINGVRNIWIIKPGDKSRGVGVILSNDLNKIMSNAQRMSGARVVQKYIENPFLLETSKRKHKMDLRVWVLVTSWEPLTVWVFHPFYGRVCKDSYSLAEEDLDKSSVHLCNFSVQRHSMYVTEEAFFTNLKLPQVEEEKLKERIDSVCLFAIQAGQNKVVHREKSFELYGVDLILDQDMNVWLLEVNLSPGLGKHDEKFGQVVSEMITGLQSIVFEKDPDAAKGWKQLSSENTGLPNNRTSSSSRKKLHVRKSNASKQRAIAIKRKQSEQQQYSTGIKFLLQGRTIGKDKISKIDSHFLVIRATETLAEFASNASALWKVAKARRRTAIIVIQSSCRQRLARKEFNVLRSRKFSVELGLRLAVFCFKREVCVKKIQRRVRISLHLLRQIRQRRMFMLWKCNTKLCLRMTVLLQKQVRRHWFKRAMFERISRRKAAQVLKQFVCNVAYRKKLTRRRLEAAHRRNELQKLRELTERRVRAVRKIKTAWTNYLFRREMSVFAIQRWWRGHYIRVVAANYIQSLFMILKAKNRVRMIRNFQRWRRVTRGNIILRKQKQVRVKMEEAEHEALMRQIEEKIKEEEKLGRSNVVDGTFLTTATTTASRVEAQRKVNRAPAKKKKTKKKGRLLKNIHQKLVPTNQSQEEQHLSESMRRHKLARPRIPPPLFDL